MKENILNFPKSKIVRVVSPDSEEVTKLKEKSKLNLADDIIEDMTGQLLTEMSEIGIDTSGTDFNKDFHFLVGVLSATIYRTLGIDHGLHDFIDKNVEVIPVVITDGVRGNSFQAFTVDDIEDLELDFDK